MLPTRLLVISLIFVSMVLPIRNAHSGPSEHQELARTYIAFQMGENGFYDLYKEESFRMVNRFEQRFEFHKKRKLTKAEVHALYLFWREQLTDIIPPSALQDSLLPLVMNSLSEHELKEINAFLQTESGKKLAAVQQGMQAFIKVTTNEMLAQRFTNDRAYAVRKEFDQRFPELRVPWGN